MCNGATFYFINRDQLAINLKRTLLMINEQSKFAYRNILFKKESESNHIGTVLYL